MPHLFFFYFRKKNVGSTTSSANRVPLLKEEFLDKNVSRGNFNNMLWLVKKTKKQCIFWLNIQYL